MEKMEFEVDAKELSVCSGDRYSVVLSFVADGEHVLAHFKAEDVVRHFNERELLDLIGESAAKRHFDIE